MLSISDLAKEYGAQVLFRSVSIRFNAGHRYGLVGANGSGKSTLLRILSGQEEASSGTTSIPKRLRLGVLSQDHFKYEDERIINVVMMGNRELWEAMQAKEELLASSDQEFDAERYSELEDIVMSQDGYTQEARAGEILEGLGIPTKSHQMPLSTLSGGFKLRVLLAQVLAANPDALLLDEPTNHLDILSIRWLEKFLSEFTGCVLVVSHDHRFLDNVCTDIVDIDYATAMLYSGNYSRFIVAKVENHERKEAEISKQQKKIAEHRVFIDRFKAKATKARQAQSKLKMIEKFDTEPLPQSSRRFPRLRFAQRRPSGKRVLEIKNISKAFGENKVLENVSLDLMKGDRLAIIGPNGIGKSTLLNVVTERLKADSGTVEWGYETHPGYFAQEHKELFKTPRMSVESWLWDVCPGEPIGFVRGQLAMVLFSGDDVEKRVVSLSGGEMARLVFCKLSVEKPNVLLLDEPTNHLDLESIEALVSSLKDYDGTLVFVSHDRWFVSRLATRILEITPTGMNDFRGTFDEYLQSCGDDHLDSEAVVLKAKRDKKKAKAKSSVPIDPAEQKRLAKHRRQLEKQRDTATRTIDSSEERVHEINELFCDPGYFAKTAPKEVKRLEREQNELRDKITNLTAEWEKIEAELEEMD